MLRLFRRRWFPQAWNLYRDARWWRSVDENKVGKRRRLRKNGCSSSSPAQSDSFIVNYMRQTKPVFQGCSIDSRRLQLFHLERVWWCHYCKDTATFCSCKLSSLRFGNQPQFQSNDKKYTAGEWSPTRPGLILMATDEGNIEVWDLLEKTHEPSVVQNVTTAAITDVTASIINAKLHLLAVSDSCGTLHILELPWNLRHPTQNEKSSVHG